MPARELAGRLAMRCEDLFFALVPDCEISGHELRGHGPDGGVWSIVIRGAKRGIFANWLDPERQAGDCLELVPQLARHGKFDLAYADPPFNAGGKRAARVGKGERVRGQHAYADAWSSIDDFLRFKFAFCNFLGI